jgi:membrane-associated phospholipid phosphatase
MSGHAIGAETVRGREQHGRPRSPRPAEALGLAVACLLAAVLVWALTSQISAVGLRDATALHDFTLLNRPALETIGNFLLHLLDPALFVVWGAALVVVAIARERPRLALAVTAVLILAPLTSETLKPLLAHPHFRVGEMRGGPASWPSGHATAALTLVLCALLVAPRRLRPLAAVLGAAFAVAVGLALLILAWHMPSDVLGGYLVATFWAALAVAAVSASDRRWPARR